MIGATMLIIGHRGAAGVAPENSLEALRAGVEAGADMLEFDIHMTADRIPVLIHDNNLMRTHKKRLFVHQATLAELREATADTKSPIVTLEEVFEEFYGKVLLNVEIKQRGIAKDLIAFLNANYTKRSKDWELFVFSSFYGTELRAIRRLAPKANLWLLHNRNPFIFIAYARLLQLDGVGFHRLYINDLALEIAKRTNLFTYAYTVNRPHTALLLSRKGLDAVVTDYPEKIMQELKKERA
jgi:glycerophosphoryl diester phosphodiesterase